MKVTDKDREAQLLAHCDSLLDGIPSNGRGYDSSRDAARRKTRKLLAEAIATARAEEREQCAKACDEIEKREYEEGDHGAWCGPHECAAAIRARGEV